MTTNTLARPAEANRPRTGASGLFGWVMFDWAGQPFYTLITTFLFAPYFASVVVGDAAQGQAVWGYTAAAAGMLVALASPLLGAMADGMGKLKPWIFWLSLLFAAAQALLWFAEPRADAGSLMLVIAAVIAATLAIEFATTLNNALMTSLVPPGQLGRLSGSGWAVGYAGGLLSLVLVAGFVVSDPATGKSLLGLEPLIANSPESRAADRSVGPLCALWYLVFIVPFFAFTPDLPGNGRRPSPGTALRAGLAQLGDTLRNLKSFRDIALFLLARMLYTDGLAAIFIFGGIYASAVFGWGSFQLGLFGIILSIAAAAGGFLGGVLDDKFGAKAVILGALALLLAGAVGIISITPQAALFGLLPSGSGSAGPAPAMFATPGEQIYLAFAVLIGIAAGPLQASSRSLMARMAPPDKIAEFFGLFAFSGKITAFAAPLAVALVTSATGSERLGIAAILVFLAAGFVLMLRLQPVERIAR